MQFVLTKVSIGDYVYCKNSPPDNQILGRVVGFDDKVITVQFSDESTPNDYVWDQLIKV